MGDDRPLAVTGTDVRIYVTDDQGQRIEIYPTFESPFEDEDDEMVEASSTSSFEIIGFWTPEMEDETACRICGAECPPNPYTDAAEISKVCRACRGQATYQAWNDWDRYGIE